MGDCPASKIEIVDWLNFPTTSAGQRFDCIEVRFSSGRKEFFRNSQNLPLRLGDVVALEVIQDFKVVKNDKTEMESRVVQGAFDVGVVCNLGELVRVYMNRKGVSPSDLKIPKVLRLATESEVEFWQGLSNREKLFCLQAKELALEHNLAMKFFDVEFQGDGSKATFFYTADERIDFRALLPHMNSVFGIKIEMKQVGARQQASRVGGLGVCGRELCCSSWMTSLPSVSTEAPRFQQIAVNVDNIIGACGKLKCCLNFELNAYMHALKDFPKHGTKIETIDGVVSQKKIDVFKRTIWLGYDRRDSFAWYEVSVEQVDEMLKLNAKGKKVDIVFFADQYMAQQSRISDPFLSILSPDSSFVDSEPQSSDQLPLTDTQESSSDKSFVEQDKEVTSTSESKSQPQQSNSPKASNGSKPRHKRASKSGGSSPVAPAEKSRRLSSSPSASSKPRAERPLPNKNLPKDKSNAPARANSKSKQRTFRKRKRGGNEQNTEN